MKKLTLEMRALQRAAELLGSERALARRLRAPMPDLLAWLDGTERPTKTMFLSAVDVLIEHGDTSGLEGTPVAPDATSEPGAATASVNEATGRTE